MIHLPKGNNPRGVLFMITEAELRLHSCCFTGHRPEKLGRSERDIFSDIDREIRNAITDGYTTYITGMSRGVDYGK